METMTTPLVQLANNQADLLSSPIGLILLVYAGGVLFEKFVKNKEWDYAIQWPLRRIEDIKQHFEKKDDAE